ncbi:hypothetical protein [Nostoc sp.]
MKTRQRTVSLPKALISLQMEYHSGDAEREQVCKSWRAKRSPSN